MSFKYSAFIENSKEAREWLESIGYENFIPMPDDNDTSQILSTGEDGYYYMYPTKQYFGMEIETDIDCRGNLELFRAITAIRDDIGLHQWHKADSIISILWHDIVGDDHNGIIRKDEVFLWDLDVEHSDVFEGDFHKMDLSELINHFKK